MTTTEEVEIVSKKIQVCRYHMNLIVFGSEHLQNSTLLMLLL